MLEQLDEIAKKRYVAPYNVALVHLGLGDKDTAFAWLERAFQARSYLLAIYLNTDARLDVLHGDPRYEELLRRMKLPPPMKAAVRRLSHRRVRMYALGLSAAAKRS